MDQETQMLQMEQRNDLEKSAMLIAILEKIETLTDSQTVKLTSLLVKLATKEYKKSPIVSNG